MWLGQVGSDFIPPAAIRDPIPRIMPIFKSRSTMVTLSKAAVGLFWLAMFIGTHVPPATDLIPLENHDKLAHFSAYLLLAMGVATAWQLATGILTTRHLLFAWLAVLAYGAFDEITQTPVGRDCSIWDWFADAAGATLGIFVFIALRKLIAPRLNWSDESQTPGSQS